MFAVMPPDAHSEKKRQDKLGQFLQSQYGQALLRIVTTVVTVLIEHYFGW